MLSLWLWESKQTKAAQFTTNLWSGSLDEDWRANAYTYDEGITNYVFDHVGATNWAFQGWAEFERIQNTNVHVMMYCISELQVNKSHMKDKIPGWMAKWQDDPKVHMEVTRDVKQLIATKGLRRATTKE